MPLVTVFSPSARRVPGFETPFLLVQDLWNDYGFQTQYHLYVRNEYEDSDRIGTVKILRKGQTAADGIQVDEDFDELPDDFISMGESLDYYQRLNELPEIERDKILDALLDVVRNSDRRVRFQDEEGWNTSIFRGSTAAGQSKEAQDAYLKDASAIYNGNYTALPDFDTALSFTPGGWSEAFSIEYDAPVRDPIFGGSSKRWRLTQMPRRCAVLIGRNGSGKSTLLSRLARVAFASPTERGKEGIQAIGVIKPDAIGFMRIITISYSAFDSFALPGVFASDLEQIAKDVERGEGRFIYCGLRDVVREVRDDLERFQAKDDELQRVQLGPEDRRPTTHLKSLDQLADEFKCLCDRIVEGKKSGDFDAALEPLLLDSSFSDLEAPDHKSLLGDDSRKAFLSWSTGHKIALHVIASIVAHAVPRSLILFDEPETHLHPPLIAALMHGVRIALEKADAFSVVATHSPVVLQETLARHVRIIERRGDVTAIHEPRGETFGENIGTLVYDAFGLTATATDFHKVLDHLIATEDSFEAINEYFTPGLSAQARAYVMAQIAAADVGEEDA